MKVGGPYFLEIFFFENNFCLIGIYSRKNGWSHIDDVGCNEEGHSGFIIFS